MKAFRSNRRALVATAAILALAVSATAQTIPPCNTGGTGGIIPTSGTGGGGTFPTTLPPNASSFTITAAVPAGATCVTEVSLRGLTHTFIGDVQFVLQDPGLNKYNIFCRAGNFSCDFGGDYTIWSPCTGASPLPGTCSGTAVLPPGTYDQQFGAWTGTNGISNTVLSSIPAAAGTWTLIAYDWAGGDTGNLTSWDICFGTPPAPSAPTVAPALTSPANAATTCDSVALVWAASACATSYDVDVDGTVYGPIGSTTFTTPVLAPGPHTWRVRGTNVSGTGPYSAVRSFTSTAVAPAAAPTLSSPANAATVSNPVTLSWTSVTCATTYDVDIDGTVYSGIGALTFGPPPLTAATHTWKVRATNAYGSSAYSASRTFTVLGPPPASNCATLTGAGGTIPTAGTGGGGTWPTVFPPSAFSSTASITTPAGSTSIVRLKINGLNHTWVGDLQIVLDDPSGVRHTILHRAGSTAGSVGSGCDLLTGDYSFYQAYGPNIEAGCSSTISPGSYLQSFGDWVSGTQSVFNDPLSAIPVIAGTNNWTLTIYDWAGGDTGTFTSWELCFNAPAVTVLDCQVAATVTQGCNSVASFSGAPSATSASPFTVTFASLNAQVNGVVFYGISGPNNAAWSPQSFLCVKPPTQRLNGISGVSGNTGGSIGNCDGQYSINFNDVIQGVYPGLLGVPMGSGQQVDVQGWQRDPASSKTTNLTDSLSFVVGP
jgi:subtilisin-like proprotein convertase family protein